MADLQAGSACCSLAQSAWESRVTRSLNIPSVEAPTSWGDGSDWRGHEAVVFGAFVVLESRASLPGAVFSTGTWTSTSVWSGVLVVVVVFLRAPLRRAGIA